VDLVEAGHSVADLARDWGSVNSRSTPGVGETASAVRWYFGSQSAEQAKQFFGMVHQAFPDLHAEVHDVIAEGELVAARVSYTGTHQGEFLGIPATGKQTTTNGVDLFRIQDGRQAEHGGGPDTLSLPMQLGVLPGSGTPAWCAGSTEDRFELTSWPSRTSSRVRWVRPRPPRELNSDRRHKSGRERPTIAVHRRIGCGHARKRLRAFSLDDVTALEDPTTR
jgi:predicted ester cyclase